MTRIELKLREKINGDEQKGEAESKQLLAGADG